MPATNAVLHDKRYSADGIFCEPPKKLDAAAAEKAETKAGEKSQSGWNSGDYHWEERDVLEFARAAANAKLVDDADAKVLWADKNGGVLEVVSVEGRADVMPSRYPRARRGTRAVPDAPPKVRRRSRLAMVGATFEAGRGGRSSRRRPRLAAAENRRGLPRRRRGARTSPMGTAATGRLTRRATKLEETKTAFDRFLQR